MPDDAARSRTGDRMMARDMPDDGADRRTFQTALGVADAGQ